MLLGAAFVVMGGLDVAAARGSAVARAEDRWAVADAARTAGTGTVGSESGTGAVAGSGTAAAVVVVVAAGRSAASAWAESS